jgi:hypothetical protein
VTESSFGLDLMQYSEENEYMGSHMFIYALAVTDCPLSR